MTRRASTSRRPPRTISVLLKLRAMQSSWRRIADDPAIKPTARAAAQARIDALEQQARDLVKGVHQ